MEIARSTILIVDDEPQILRVLGILFSRDFEVVLANSAAKARQILEQRQVDIILTDQRMPNETGIQFLEWVTAHFPRTIRLLMTAYPELEEIAQAVNEAHIFRVIFKPFKNDNLLEQVYQAAHLVRLEQERELWQQQLEQKVVERTRQLQKACEDLDQKSQELAEVNAQLQISNHTLEELALRDSLTGLSNARAMSRIATKEIQRHERYPDDLALGFVDIDDFKKINTDYCHTGGDEVLRQLAQCLLTCVREVDTVSRNGGDEFLILAPSTNLEGARVLAERIRSAVANAKFSYEDCNIPLTISVGFIVIPAGRSLPYEEMKRQASQAVLDAKKNNKNICIVRELNPLQAKPHLRTIALA